MTGHEIVKEESVGRLLCHDGWSCGCELRRRPDSQWVANEDQYRQAPSQTSEGQM